MKKLKKVILSVLLFTFAFITVHDYVIPELNTHVNCEVSSVESSKSVHDAKTQHHESIHNLIFEPSSLITNIFILDIYQKQTLKRDLFISQINPVRKRPPLV